MAKRPSPAKKAASAKPAKAAKRAAAEPAKAASTRPPSREGKRVLSIYLPPETWKLLRHLSTDCEKSTQTLGEEAISLLLEKYRIA